VIAETTDNLSTHSPRRITARGSSIKNARVATQICAVPTHLKNQQIEQS